MAQSIACGLTPSPSSLMGTVEVRIGSYQFTDQIPILCPNDPSDQGSHHVVRNGLDVHLKDPQPQFWCKRCDRFFYAHTSRIIYQFQTEFHALLKQTLFKGRFNAKHLSQNSGLSVNQSHRLLHRILHLLCTQKERPGFWEKHRNSNALFVDETFITIMHKTWYLVTILSGNNKIMKFQLMSTRNKTQIQKLIQDCARRLNYRLRLLVTDGFGIYKGIVLDLGIPLIHIRHIHAPPYGRIEIDTIIYHPHHIEVICASTTTDILLQTGVFLAQVERKVKIRYGTKKRGRKAGGQNRSTEVIIREKQRKMLKKGMRGRQKGCKNPRRTTETHVFYFDQKAGRVCPWGGSSERIAMTVESIVRQFSGLHITTNLIEKEHSAFKKILDFRGKRSVKNWIELLTGYFMVREDPKMLDHLLKGLKIPASWLYSGLEALSTIHIGATRRT